MVVVRNPRSGSAVETAALEQALRDAGITADVLDSPDGPGAKEWIDGVCAGHDVIVAAGGDGTVSGVAAGVARAGKTLAVIPTGTLNHFARDAGIPTDLAAAVALIRSGAPRPLDAGVVNDHVFLNNVSLGSYPRMVHERELLERGGRSRRVAGIIATARTWWRLRSLTASITIDGRDLIRRSPFIVVGNGSYDLSGFDLTKRHNISDQQLSLYVAPRAGRLGALSLPFRALLGTLARYEQFETHRAKEITIVLGQRHVPAGIDGEVLELESPLRFTVKPGALRVIVP
jgi:diacylglycerol kinase family enzyme